MLDHVVIFSKSGAVLWSQTMSKLRGDPVEALVKTVLLEDRMGEKQWTHDLYTLQWQMANKLDLVFVVVYQKVLQLLYVDELLDAVKSDFTQRFPQQIAECQPVHYDEQFGRLLTTIEQNAMSARRRNKPKTTLDVKKLPSSGGQTMESTANEATEQGDLNKDKNIEKDEFEELKKMSKKKPRVMKTGPGRKKSKKGSKASSSESDKPKSGKKMTKWEGGKVGKDELNKLDYSQEVTADQEEAQLKEMRETYMGGSDNSDEEFTSDPESDNFSSEYESDVSTGSESTSSSWNFSSTRIGNFLSTISGNKVLERGDLTEVIDSMRHMLIGKNVASEVADDLCESVVTTLINQRLESFTRISTVVRKALEEALTRILTPKKSTDILREIHAAKAAGRVYSVVFIGVNGVGKSTSLSKVCYYLKSNNIKVMIAACDTFRSGAVEQLNQHAKVLDVPLYQRGYAKDPAAVARDAVKHAGDNGFDCVLIDTAGRMQNNEPLMRALAKLVSSNSPDLVLFVGEALVGNDGIDQLGLFDRALIDYSDRSTPHRIDGIVLTKFDTIDDKVGAAVSMVYKTGQPIMFVGTGQKYTNLKKLNVRKILRSLLDD